MGERYTDDRYQVVQAITIPVAGADAAADDELARFRFFTNVKVTEVRAIVGRTKGKADTSAITVKKGTTSIGACTLGTATEGSVKDASLTDTSFTTADDIVLHNVVATDTFAANVMIFYQNEFTNA